MVFFKRYAALLLSLSISAALFVPVVYAQNPFQETLRALPGENKPQNLSMAINYIQIIPYTLWILRNPRVWGHMLSLLPTFLSEIPSFLSYLRFYILQLPGALSYLLSFTTNNLELWIGMFYNSICSIVSDPFSTVVKLFVEYPFGLVFPNLPYMCYSVLTSIPYLIESIDFLISTMPQTLVSYAAPTVGAFVSIAPQFMPVFFSSLSSCIDWLNIVIELLPEYCVRLSIDILMWFLRVSYDMLYSSYRCLTFTIPILFRSLFFFLQNVIRLLPYIPDSLSYLQPFFEELSLLVDALPDFMVSIILAITSAISAFVASFPVSVVNLLNAVLMSIPLCLQSCFKFCCGIPLLLSLNLPAACLCGVLAYAFSVCSTFVFITLPKEIYHMIRSAISLIIGILGIILSRCFALPFILCYDCLSTPYALTDQCADLCRSLVEPSTKYIASRITLLTPLVDG